VIAMPATRTPRRPAPTRDTATPERDYTLASVHNAARLLCAFSTTDTEYGVSELARKLQLAKSTVHRLLTTLAEEELVERNPRTGRYRLGLKMWELGTLAAGHLTLHEAAAPYLDDLRNRSRETVHIAVLDGTEVVYVERRESPQTLRLFGRVGHRNSAHCTSTGKVLLAFLPPDELERRLADIELVAKTPYTITDPERLRAELALVRKRGYAVNVNESELGIASVAAPILDRSGTVVAAVSTAGPLTRFEGPAMRHFAEMTVDAARHISERLGFRPGRRRAPEGQ
jgi:DNA-binding IclR family transcriptional regulator